MRLLRAVLLASAACVVSACGGEPCAKLSEALCDGGDPDYCQQVDGWLAGRLIDPQTKAPLEGEARTQMCTTIHGSVDIFNAYRFKAKQKLLGEPDFTLASSTPAANKADPPPKTELKRPSASAPTPPSIPDTPDPPEEKEADERERPGGQNMSD